MNWVPHYFCIAGCLTLPPSTMEKWLKKVLGRCRAPLNFPAPRNIQHTLSSLFYHKISKYRSNIFFILIRNVLRISILFDIRKENFSDVFPCIVYKWLLPLNLCVYVCGFVRVGAGLAAQKMLSDSLKLELQVVGRCQMWVLSLIKVFHLNLCVWDLVSL